jgi:hypothetical protein
VPVEPVEPEPVDRCSGIHFLLIGSS